MVELFTRHGEKIAEAAIRRDAKGKPFCMQIVKCSRCGGAGGADMWKFTGWKCFDCGGRGDKGHKAVALFTAEQVEKLNAAKAKRDAKKAAAWAAKEAARKAEADAAASDFQAMHGALLARCEPFLERNPFIEDVVRKGRANCRLSDGQVAALEAAIAKIEAEDARKAGTQFIGKVGERIRGLKIKVVRVVTGESQWGIWRIATCRTEDGNTVVIKSGAFRVSENDELVITGTVKAHDEFRGEKQTQLERVKEG